MMLGIKIRTCFFFSFFSLGFFSIIGALTPYIVTLDSSKWHKQAKKKIVKEHIKAMWFQWAQHAYYITSSLGRERKRETKKTRHASEKNKNCREKTVSAGRAREFRVNELICIENEDSRAGKDGGYAPDDDLDDVPAMPGMRDLTL